MDDPRSNMEFDHGRVEARSVAFTDVDASTDGSTFTGYAAVFDHEADLGDFTESISRGAFRKAIGASGNIPMLYDHNPGLPVLATTGAGTLKLKEDGKGLRVEANVARHFIGDAVREMVQRGDIRGMSFGFVAGAGNSKVEQRGGKPHRSLTGFKRLLDVSPTWDPAYSGTSAELRSLRALQIAEELEQDLKDPTRLLRAKVEFRALTTAQLQNTLGGLQSTAEAIEAALNNVGIGEPEEAEEVAPGPFTDQQYIDALETIQALVEGAEGLLESAGLPDPDEGEPSTRSTEQHSGADWQTAAAARSRRLQILGLAV
jgi:HK97 family phage prohead protease